ncbi:MAG: hypothetical protein FD165_2377 [Gammaproteobacteria bacterium]|nr:MAG: hypothetical protein FD165_2377 [Gammaproteobacteria bacterium]TND01966.1 MAG: hypothetical protein FD120_2494 [Gammaproteobacteria bacterium]
MRMMHKQMRKIMGQGSDGSLTVRDIRFGENDRLSLRRYSGNVATRPS